MVDEKIIYELKFNNLEDVIYQIPIKTYIFQIIIIICSLLIINYYTIKIKITIFLILGGFLLFLLFFLFPKIMIYKLSNNKIKFLEEYMTYTPTAERIVLPNMKYNQINYYQIENKNLIINYNNTLINNNNKIIRNFNLEELQKIEEILKSKGVKKLENTQNQN